MQPTPQYGQIVSVLVCATRPTCRRRACRTRSWPSVRPSDRPRCSCRSTRTPTREAGRRTPSRCARRTRGRRRRSRRCSDDPVRTPRRTCSRGCTSRSRARTDRCRSSPARRRSPRTRGSGVRVMSRDRRVARPRRRGGAGGPNRSGFASYSSIHSATSGVVERSTDDASSSSTSLRLCFTRSELVCTTIPSSAAREHDGTSTRAPSISTTHMRHAFTGCSVSRKQSVGISMPICAASRRAASCPREP